MRGHDDAFRRGWLFLVLTGVFLAARWAAGADGAEPAGDGASLDDAPQVAAASLPGGEHPLGPAIRMAQASLTRMQSIDDYETTLVRRDLAAGPDSEQTMHLKLRERPLSVYLKYGEPFAGREVLYVQGENGDQVLTHEGKGVRFPVSTTVDAPPGQAAKGDARPAVAEYGMRQRLEKIIAQWKFESLYGECDVQFYPDAKLRGVPCEVIESSHPRPRRQFKFQKTRLYIDAQTRLPVRIEQHAFAAAADQQPQVLELYDYVNLRTNVGLTDADFDRRNPNYSF